MNTESIKTNLLLMISGKIHPEYVIAANFMHFILSWERQKNKSK